MQGTDAATNDPTFETPTFVYDVSVTLGGVAQKGLLTRVTEHEFERAWAEFVSKLTKHEG